MTYDIILAGVGGQGVLSLTAIIAGAAMKDGYDVRQSEVHGMAQRGGAVQAALRISDTKVHGDLVPRGGADMILSLEPVESLRYASYLKPEGVVVSSSDPFVNIPDYPDIEKILAAIRSLPRNRIVPAMEIAKKAGLAKASNMAMVGAASSFIPVRPESLEGGIRELFASKEDKVVEGNLKAFELGRNAGDKCI
jgi:indolepyruvate ferredoxin oxidoreductase beta subunit